MIGFAKVTRDLTERKKAEEEIHTAYDSLEKRVQERTAELEKANERLKKWELTFKNAGWGVVITDHITHALLMVNPAFARMHGYPEEELIGKLITDTFVPEFRNQISKIAQIVHKEGHYIYESLHLKKDGSTFPVLTDVVAIRSQDGNTLYRASNMQDISERKQFEEERSKLLVQLQDAIKIRDEFLSIASHELKTPLTSLKAQIQILQRSTQPELHVMPPIERLCKGLKLSNRQVDRLTMLVEDLLDVSKIQLGKLSLSFESVNLSELVEDLLDRYSEECIRAKCSVSIDAQKNVIGYWDRGRMEQIIVNLLSNAVKYAPGHPIHIGVQSDDQKAIFWIQDFGPGIPPEKQQKIFERFERATSSRNISGLGLGLFIVKQIVEVHQGSIHVDSEFGKGTKFIVELPLRPAQAGLMREISGIHEEKYGGKHKKTSPPSGG